MSNSKNKNFFAIFGLLFSAFIWGVIWFPYRLMAQVGISGVASSFYTYGIVLVLAGCIFYRHWREILILPRSVIYLSLAAGWTNLSYVLAVIDGEVMRVMLLFYLSPLWTLILAHFWLKEKTHIIGYVAIAVSLLGAFIMLFDGSGWPLPRNQAEWLALSAGMGFSLTNVMTRKSVHLSLYAKYFSVWVGVVWVSLLFWFVAGGTLPTPATLDWEVWGILLFIACLLMVATIFVQYGVTQISATRASVLFLFELVVAAVAAYYLAAETMTLNEWIGGGLIILAALFAAKNEED